MDNTLLTMRSIAKRFSGVTALDNVTFSVRSGDIHALVGENGAGKSTLMKVLSGVHPHGSYEGEIIFDSTECRFRSVVESKRAGIAIIHQELALVPGMSITENLFLGNEIRRRGLIDWDSAHRQARELLEPVGLSEDPNTLVETLGVGKQQLIEIARALAKDVKLLVLDEPTAALNDRDSERLLELLKRLRRDGLTSILISHKLGEVIDVADRVTILRDGVTVETIDDVTGLTIDRVAAGMVGRDVAGRFPSRSATAGPTLFDVADWSVEHTTQAGRMIVQNVDFHVRRGEVVGFAGLMGAGRTELAMSLFGESYGRKVSGFARIDGDAVDLTTVPSAIRAGLAYVTEDRKDLGLVLDAPIYQNVSLANLVGVANGPFINGRREFAVAGEYEELLKIKLRDLKQEVRTLSGGNQQKVVLAKWLFTNADVLILDEPTRGIDVGAKWELYEVINDLVESGKAVIVISSELPEVLGLSDRVYVMNEGRIIGELDRTNADAETVMEMILSSSLEE